ncbi:MAG: DUF4163 domain-containing protein, partial [Novosphingobium sp.]
MSVIVLLMPQRIDQREKKPHLSMRAALPVVMLLGSALLIGCTRQSEGAADAFLPEASARTADGAIPDAKASDGAASAIVSIENKTDAYDFSWSWPAVAEAIPALAGHLKAERAQSLADLAKDAESWKAEAEKNGFPFHSYSLQKDWEVVADTPQYLSLSAQAYTYTGGAHGMSYFDALVWDRDAGKSMEPVAMFTSIDALDAAVRPAFCQLLDRQRVEKRGEPLSKDRSGMFEDCITVKSTTVILGSANRQKFDRIGFLIGPYEAGPYAEGS